MSDKMNWTAKEGDHAMLVRAGHSYDVASYIIRDAEANCTFCQEWIEARRDLFPEVGETA